MNIIKMFIVTVLFCVCGASVACGAFMAEENVRYITFGENRTSLALSQRENGIAFVSGTDMLYIDSPVESLKTTLSLAPPPISTIYRLAQCIEELYCAIKD